jgi:hypothetical protein
MSGTLAAIGAALVGSGRWVWVVLARAYAGRHGTDAERQVQYARIAWLSARSA